jgi:hypothetical protein
MGTTTADYKHIINIVEFSSTNAPPAQPTIYFTGTRSMDANV